MHVGYGVNEYGTLVSLHRCDTCGGEFSLCPAVTPEKKGWGSCLGVECVSYDPRRDADKLFAAGEVKRDE